MSTWYKTSRYAIEITPVEVLGETEHFVTLAPGGWHKGTRRVSKDGYHRTFSDARTCLMDRLSREIERLKHQTEKASEEMRKVFLMEQK